VGGRQESHQVTWNDRWEGDKRANRSRWNERWEGDKRAIRSPGMRWEGNLLPRQPDAPRSPLHTATFLNVLELHAAYLIELVPNSFLTHFACYLSRILNLKYSVLTPHNFSLTLTLTASPFSFIPDFHLLIFSTKSSSVSAINDKSIFLDRASSTIVNIKGQANEVIVTYLKLSHAHKIQTHNIQTNFVLTPIK